MKKLLKYSVSLFAATALVVGCGSQQQQAPIDVGELVPYEDAAVQAKLMVPTNWAKGIATGSDLTFYFPESSLQRFVSYDAQGVAGAKIRVRFVPLDSGTTLESYFSKVFQEESEGSIYSAVQDVSLGAVPAKMISYKVTFPDGMFMGEQYVASKDSQLVTIVELEAFGGQFESLKPTFDQVIKSLEPGMKVVAAPAAARVDTVFNDSAFVPAATTKPYSGSGFTIEIPSNFSGKKNSAPNTLSSVKITGQGGPADCSIQVDVLDASKQKNLDKIVAETKTSYEKSKFNVQAPAAAKVGSLSGKVLSYTYGESAGKAYFAIKGDKLYRVTINWYRPEEATFKPVFEKAVSTFSFD